ncbi:uncharacterized protein LOC126195624 [Schistocerca nitens]|uniref:uncharacterized protein LOC126195624 n=1 Tax=Schistocerca nitens TaxID=7011 RepID=UPI00211750E9|nr:uncharacterized protein LOC126195624 [Schistocerca nitens]
MTADRPSDSTAGAAEAASDLGYLLAPLHWTAIMRHPRSVAGSALLFRLCTLVLAAISLSFFCSEIAVVCRQGTADLDVFTLTLSVSDTTGTWLVRLVHIAIREHDFHRLALQVGQDFAEFLTADDVPVLMDQGRAARRFTLTYIWFGIAASAYWLVSPVSPEGLPFILALPYDATTPLGYAVSWLYCTIVTVHVVVMTMVFDAFNCVPLVLCVDRNADLLERCLGGMLLGQSLSIGAVACFQMFQVAMSADGLQQIGKFGCYLFAMLAELFIYCWFGDDLITESENLALAAYDAVTSLQGCPLSIKKSLLLIMHRAQRPLRITAGGFFPLSRESFVATEMPSVEDRLG